MTPHDERLADLQEHPERHRHDFGALTACCTIAGVLHADLIDAHSSYVDLGSNGGVRCDTVRGPCACGA